MKNLAYSILGGAWRNGWRKATNILITRSSSTIFGLSSGFGKCGVSVIRVSGDAAKEILTRKTRLKCLPAPRKAMLTNVYHGRTNEMIDRGLLLWFPGPHSFTGEDTIEFHVHGGTAILSAMYDSLAAFGDTRIAEPGEFTKRAFYAGKMDLTEVEGLADLIHAETEAQRRQALRQANGQLAAFCSGLRSRLVKVIAGVEAYIDFAEDQDVDDGVLDGSVLDIQTLIGELEVHLNDNRRGERLRHGVRMAIVGAPNVGKSSLINLLSQRNVSIVTNIAGTTRDIVESHYDIEGYPVILADTAGLRTNPQDVVESEGIARAKTYCEGADLIVLVLDASCVRYPDQLDSYAREYVASIGLTDELLANALFVFNKCDLVSDGMLEALKRHGKFTLLSCENQFGLPELLTGMKTHLERLCGAPSMESPTITQERHRFHLRECLECLERYRDYFSETPEAIRDLAIATHHLRNAVRCIGKITGSVETEEILDVIFSTFCIGK